MSTQPKLWCAPSLIVKPSMPALKRLSPFVLLFALAACASVPARSPTAMVAAANPMAVEAGLQVLKAGGSAVDAAVAVQAVLGLVEPQSSGLGGGAFLTYYDAKTRQVTAYDGRETAPAGATPELFLAAPNRPMPRREAYVSGRATGAPGAVAMLAMAQAAHGTLAWKDLFGEAQRLAEQGFPAPGRMAAAAASSAPQAAQPDAVAYFTKPDGTKVQAGDLWKNPAYAATVRRVAAEGPSAILTGPIAEAIVARAGQEPRPGTLSTADLAGYKPTSGPALCRPYRIYLVCVPDAPSGGPGLLIGLGILANTDIDKRGPADPQAWYLLSQASRLMYADRDLYVGDPAFADVPVEGLLEPAYLAGRAKLIGASAGDAPAAGKPRGAPARAADATAEPSGTSHFVVVDGAGNVASMTTTVESVFGTGRMVGGFFLNNQLTDFSFMPRDVAGGLVANAVEPGKRPRSSMAPAVVLDRRGRFVAAVGSPGGPAILAYNLKALVAILDWKLPPDQALALPNLIAIKGFYAGEADKFAPGVVDGLAARGVKVTPAQGAEGSGLHAVVATPNGLVGAADPRREGAAKGF